ncbi:MAG: chitobiase/beta-hexosaminidase C-terminal domain-containing protein, partial [Muribaculaceae bacterium]|nr:chitobiase/beta-hexosaminidase C-terminal domain-containing protein [Muribaculaceae bacterium]
MRKLLTFFMLSLLGVIAYAGEVTFTFSDEDYDNQQEVTSVSKGSISIAFDKGTNNNPPTYYSSGTALRCYGGNYFTVSSSSGDISKIVFTFGSSDGSNALSVDVGTFESTTSTWTGSAAAVTFTVGGTSGHRRLAVIKVTYGGSESDPTAPTAAVSFSPGAGSVAYGTMVSLSTTVDDAQGIKYTLDDSDPTSSTTAAPYNAPIKLTESCTIKAAAFNYGKSKYAWGEVSSASYTVSAPSGTTYTRVTSLSSADVGRKFIIVCQSQGKAMGEMYSSGNTKYGKSVSLENLDATN